MQALTIVLSFIHLFNPWLGTALGIYSLWVLLQRKTKRLACLHSKPEDAKAHFDRGVALYKKGNLDGAIAEYREAIRLKPERAALHYILGAALEVKGEKQAALVEYRKASELDPGNKQLHSGIAAADLAENRQRVWLGNFGEFSRLPGGATIPVRCCWSPG